jgi:hypothetical protein
MRSRVVLSPLAGARQTAATWTDSAAGRPAGWLAGWLCCAAWGTTGWLSGRGRARACAQEAAQALMKSELTRLDSARSDDAERAASARAELQARCLPSLCARPVIDYHPHLPAPS